jgi:hypothetical protein
MQGASQTVMMISEFFPSPRRFTVFLIILLLLVGCVTPPRQEKAALAIPLLSRRGL